MGDMMRALTIVQPHQAEMRTVEVPEPDNREVLIEVQACGICGTDVHIFHGEYMGSYPIIPGHEFAGVVKAVGEDVNRVSVGDRVAVEPNIACDNCFACLHNRQNFCHNWEAVGVTRPGGMAQYVVAPEKTVFGLNDLSFEVGAFMEPLSCVIHGVERAQIQLADRVAIVGAGPIGLLLLQVIQRQGATSITVAERQPARLELARSFGADRAVSSADELGKEAYDVVVDATGAVGVMSRTLEWVRRGGTVLLFGVPPRDTTLSLDAFAFFEKGVTVRSSFTSVRNSYQALGMLKSGQVEVEPLISHCLPLEAFERGVHLIEQGLEGVTKVLLLPNG